ncbi:MAG: CBS domain-containing protein [Saprospiraceae bacterium]|nr:CBS domain-containing protein [Saprospiraceae bacterium]
MSEIKHKELSFVMQENVITLNAYNTVAEAVEILSKKGFHHIPILDDQNKLIGIVSQTDIDKISWGKSLFENKDQDNLNTSIYESLLVRDIMTRDVHFLYDDQKVEQAIKIFYKGKFHALPIMRDGDVVGIITPQDILNLLL